MLQIPSHNFTKIVFKPLRTNLFFNVFFAFFLFFTNTKICAQELGKGKKGFTPKKEIKNTIKSDAKEQKTIVKTDTIHLDSIKKPKAFLESKVKYKAKLSAQFDQKKRLLTLTDEAELYFQDYELKAGKIVMDYTKNEVYAGRLKDTAGNYIQLPYFKQGTNIIEPDSIRFNFNTKKALVFNSRTNQGELNIKAYISKKESDSVYYMKNARITTAKDLDDPEYYFLARKAKFVTGKNKKVVVGFTNMFIADVPTPLALPFAFFPMTTNNQSGIIIPSYGQSVQRGYSLQNGGYYFALSDKYNLAILGDYYTNGSYSLRGESSYALKYKFSGNVNIRYENLINSERGYPDYSKSSLYNIQWSHSKDAKSNPTSRFSASVNLGSSKFFQNSINPQNTGSRLNNTLSSSVSYNKTFQTVPQVNIGLTANHTQNSQTQKISMTLPNLTASVDRIFPFAMGGGTKKGFIKNINLQYSLSGRNSIETVDSLFLTKKMFDDSKTSFSHDIPISTNFKIFKYFSVTSGAAFKEFWTLQTIKKTSDFTTGADVNTRVNGFDAFRTYSFSNSVSTTIYGTYNFKGKGKLKSIRHTMSPSASYNYAPSFSKYFQKYETASGFKEYTRFEGGDAPNNIYSSSVGFSLSNTFEAKVTDKDSTKTELKKIKLLNSLNFNTSYDIPSGRWSDIRMTGGTLLFNQKMNVNFGATFNPYRKIIDQFTTVNPFAMTQANLTLSYAVASSAEKEKKKNEQSERNGGRNDDLYGTNTDLANRNQDQFDKKDEDKEDDFKGFYNVTIPWDLNLAYSLTYSNMSNEKKITNSSVQISANTDLTPKWKLGVSTGYDMVNKGITFTQIRIQRDLLSWKMDVNWQPFGPYANWGFFIGIKSSILSDIKYDKRTQPDRILR